jgi:hypothetical protein
LKMIWKETIATLFSPESEEILRKLSVRGVPAEIRTGYLANTCHMRYRLSELGGWNSLLACVTCQTSGGLNHYQCVTSMMLSVWGWNRIYPVMSFHKSKPITAARL